MFQDRMKLAIFVILPMPKNAWVQHQEQSLEAIVKRTTDLAPEEASTGGEDPEARQDSQP